MPPVFWIIKTLQHLTFVFFILSSSPLIWCLVIFPQINWKETIQSSAWGKPLILLNTCLDRDCCRRLNTIIAYPTVACFSKGHWKGINEKDKLFKEYNLKMYIHLSKNRKIPDVHTLRYIPNIKIITFFLKHIIFTYHL